MQKLDNKQNNIQSFAFVVSIGVCLIFSFFFAAPDLSTVQHLRLAQLASQINPNDATIASLVRLPGIGFVRATTIVSYRENSKKQHGTVNKQVFKNPDDLEKVKGIGPKTIQKIGRASCRERV